MTGRPLQPLPLSVPAPEDALVYECTAYTPVLGVRCQMTKITCTYVCAQSTARRRNIVPCSIIQSHNSVFTMLAITRQFAQRFIYSNLS